MSSQTSAPAARQPEPPSAHPLDDETERAIPSQALLAGRASVTIDHRGVRYILRATRAGKLILTK